MRSYTLVKKRKKERNIAAFTQDEKVVASEQNV